ncbi:MAG: ACT domain-containing protein [Thermoanaerobaculaceae bacterium]|jgi:hypothetical protein|nr:ACT domain-containing protein [Thermoanaerobaculaceae bacterium]
MESLRFRVLDPELAVVRQNEGDPLARLDPGGEVWAVLRTPGELTVVCEASRVPAGAEVERGWVALALQGPFPFGVTGVLAAVAAPLAAAGVPIFALSTFDTDVVLVKRAQLDDALCALGEAGHTLVS